jgi:3-oxoacyl-[acyl-carrier-protein] synthase II
MSELTDHRGRPRVVITGVGLQTPAGVGLEEVWSTLLAGKSMAGPIQRFDASPLAVRFGCEMRNFDPVPYLGPKDSRRVDRAAAMGFAAAADALADAGDPGVDPARGGVITGTGIGGLITLEEQVKLYLEKGPDRVSPFFVPMMMANATAGIIGINLGWTGPNLCISTACAAGANAIGEATRIIRDGTADAIMAGGTECAITPPAVAAFARMGALSKRNDEPELASRPFDADRDGFVMGEGAAMVVLERADRAAARGARVYGEVAGYGTNSDAFHITAPSQGGAGAAACMQLAIEDAGLSASDIAHVNAHGTSTDLNDSAESEAIRKVFGDAPPPVTSTKGVTGHLIGAAGALEAIAAVRAAREGLVPPTANFHRLGDDIAEIDVVHDEPRRIPVGAALSNSFGFGGHNATLVLVPAP